MNYRPSSDITVTSTTGYYDIKQSTLVDPTVASAAGPAVVVYNRYTRHDFTQELRISSDFSSPLNFTIGGYYQDGKITNPSVVYANFVPGVAPETFQDSEFQIKLRTISAFGQIRYKVVPQVELSAGARYYDEERTAVEFVSALPFSPPYARNTPTPLADPRLHSQKVNPEFSITYIPTDNLTAYATYKEASKSGSFNTASGVPAGSKVSFGDESAKGFEVGLKGRLFDRSLTFTLAGYHYKYGDLQVGANQFENGLAVFRTFNAASAKVYGIELMTSYRVPGAEGLRLNASVNWNKARYESFRNAQCYGGQTIAAGCNRDLNTATGLFNSQDLSGQPLVRAPEWTANAGFDYSTQISSGMNFSIAASTLYSSSYFTNGTLRADATQKAFAKANLTTSISGPEDNWEVALIGTNIFDKVTASSCFNSPFRDGGFAIPGLQINGGPTSGLQGVDSFACTLERGRSVMVRLTVRR